MARVKITEFGVIQKALAGATVQIFEASDNGENTGVLATLYKESTGSETLTNPQNLDEDGKLTVDCYVSSLVVGEISNISDLASRSLSKIRANPLEFPLGATNANFSGSSVAETVNDSVEDAQNFAEQAGDYFDAIEEVFGGTSSTTSHSLNGGSKTFTIAAGLPFSAGQYVIITYNPSPTSFLMHGQITSYVGTALTVTIGFVTGSGTYSDWNIITSGPRGSKGDTGATGAGTGDVLAANLGSEYIAGAETFRSNIGLVDTAITPLTEVRSVPQNSQSADYTIIASDAGKHIYHPASDANDRVFTIPSNSSVGYPVGTAITFVNMSANDLTIDITSDTLYLAGSGAVGSRSLARYGEATALKISATGWIISGVGLS